MSDQPSFTVVFAFGDGATLSVGESGNDFSAYRVIAIANGDYTERLNDAENQLAEARAENERLEELLREIVEVYAGMEGFEPETAPEAYCLRIIEQMYNAALGGDGIL